MSPIVGATTGTGVGAGYENINKTGKFGLRLFAMVGIDHPSYMVMPSLRIYPFGQRIGSFFVSPGLFAGYGNHILNADSITAAGTKDRYTYMQQDFLTGFFVVAGMNLHLTPNILLSVETGGGINYNDLALGDKSSDAGFGKVEVSFGWRF